MTENAGGAYFVVVNQTIMYIIYSSAYAVVLTRTNTSITNFYHAHITQNNYRRITCSLKSHNWSDYHKFYGTNEWKIDFVFRNALLSTRGFGSKQSIPLIGPWNR